MIYLITNQQSMFNSSYFDIISLEKGIDLIKDLEEISLDSETKGLDCYTKGLLLLQLGNYDIQVLFDITSYDNKVPEALKNFLNTSTALFIIQNVKFDLKFLYHQGIIITKVYDTMLAEIILTNGLQYDGRDLATLCQKYCGQELDKSVRGEIITKGLNDNVLFYGANDIKYLSMIKRKQLAIAEEMKLLQAIALDNAFVIVLAYVEYCGIKLDYPKWILRTDKSIEEVLVLKQQLETKLWEDKKYNYFSGMADMFTGAQDCILNWDSPKQVIKLFKEYGINVIVRSQGVESKSIDAKILEPQRNKFDILPLYLDYKGKQKEVSTYGYSWKRFINPVTGRIHTTFQQLMDTGRLSSGNKKDGTPKLNWAA